MNWKDKLSLLACEPERWYGRFAVITIAFLLGAIVGGYLK